MSAFNTDRPVSSNLSHCILITLTLFEPNFIALQTYTPSRGKSQRFLMDKSALLSLLSGERASFVDSDLSNYLHLWFDGSVLSCKAVWLSVNPRDNATGYVQRFCIPASLIHRVLSGSEVRHVAHTDEPLPKAKLTFSSGAQAEISHYSTNKFTRRALSKFFRDYLNYGSDEHINVQRRHKLFQFREQDADEPGNGLPQPGPLLNFLKTVSC